MKREPLDRYDEYPREMLVYLRNFGWHFNKKMLEFACSKLKSKYWNQQQVDDLLKKYSIVLSNNELMDYVYVCNMGVSRFLNASIPDEQHLAMYIKDVIDDKDGYDGMVFNRWYADCVKMGIPIDWAEML